MDGRTGTRSHVPCGPGVECRVPVKTPVHRMPGFRRDVHLPETERAADETLALPVDGTLTKREMQRIVSACNALGGLLQPAFDPAESVGGRTGWEHGSVRGMIYFVAARETSKVTGPPSSVGRASPW